MTRLLAGRSPATVHVELVGTLTRGQTVADFRGLWGRTPNALVAHSTDPQRFFEHLGQQIAEFARTF